MSNEVAKLFDDLFIDFIEQNDIQIWPERNAKGIPTGWVVQCPVPFKQVTRGNLKAALTYLAFELGDLRFKQ